MVNLFQAASSKLSSISTVSSWASPGDILRNLVSVFMLTRRFSVIIHHCFF
jgi:hypothetical protein